MRNYVLSIKFGGPLLSALNVFRDPLLLSLKSETPPTYLMAAQTNTRYMPPPPSPHPPEFFLKRTVRTAVSSVSGTQESVSQGRPELTQILFKR